MVFSASLQTNNGWSGTPLTGDRRTGHRVPTELVLFAATRIAAPERGGAHPVETDIEISER